jgi:translation initiation factor RLI1
MIDQLSGGELQRFAIAVCCVQKADVYVFSCRPWLSFRIAFAPFIHLDTKI